MSALARARFALPLSFAIYVLEAVISAYATLPWSLELGRRPLPSGSDALARAALLERLPELGPILRMAGVQGLLACGLLALLSPWLQMSWLSALSQPVPLRTALHAGARLWLRACAVSLSVALVGVLVCAPWALLAYGISRALADSFDARLHDLLPLAALAPLLPSAVYLGLLHDLARARALQSGAAASVRACLALALRPALVLRALGLFALGHGLVIGAQLSATLLPDGQVRSIGAIALLQSALLTRVLLRAVWLATALTCVRTATGAGARRTPDQDGA